MDEASEPEATLRRVSRHQECSLAILFGNGNGNGDGNVHGQTEVTGITRCRSAYLTLAHFWATLDLDAVLVTTEGVRRAVREKGAERADRIGQVDTSIAVEVEKARVADVVARQQLAVRYFLSP